MRPDHVVLLHRDWRYKALLRPVFRGPLTSVTREPLPELTAYTRLFASLARNLHLPERDLRVSQPFQKAPSGRIGVLVGGARNQKVDFAEKRWPRFPELTRLLVEKTQSKIVLFGGPDDTDIAETVLAAVTLPDRVENLVGKISLEQVPVAIAALDAFISIDSGLAHIAAAVMTARHQKIITLFGPTDPRIWAPVSSGHAGARLHYKARPCSPCYGNDGTFQPCRFEGEYFQHCMTDISAEEVLKSLY
ncbi:MAG: glycosyltransferase family 9 protein [Deltaproteobacteria bacterium]|nr:glycosyltransferase family 9 protein [Deltaproteobacteria bacterium]